MQIYRTIGLLIVSVASLSACGAIPVGVMLAVRDAQWRSMDQIEDQWVARREERKKLREQLATVPADSAEAAALNERLVALNAEIAELARRLDVPQ